MGRTERLLELQSAIVAPTESPQAHISRPNGAQGAAKLQRLSPPERWGGGAQTEPPCVANSGARAQNKGAEEWACLGKAG